MFKRISFNKLETEAIKLSLRGYFNTFIFITRDTTVTAGNNTDDAFTNCAVFSTFKSENNDLFKQTNSTKCDTECVKSNLWDYFDTFILVPRDITVTADNNTDVTVTNCALFSTCKTQDNDCLKQNNSANFETESIKSNLWGYFHTFTSVRGDIAVIASNNTEDAFTNRAQFYTCKTLIKYFLPQQSPPKFEKESIKSRLWDSFNAFILVRADILVTGDNNTRDAFTNCAIFSSCKTEINDLIKWINFTKLEIAAIKSSLWGYFQTFTSTAGYLKVTRDNNTDVALTNCTPFFTSEPPTNYLFIQNNSANFETECIKWSLWDYFGALISVTGDITVTADNNTDVAFTTFAPFSKCKTKINDLFKQSKSIEFETESIKSSLWDYFEAFISIGEDITVTADNNNTDVAFTNCTRFSTCKTPINYLFKHNSSTYFETESIKSILWD